MNLKSFEQVLRSRKWFVIGVIAFAVALSPFLRFVLRPTYSASAEITYVGNSADAVVLPADLPELAISSSVVNRAIADGHLSLDPGQLLARLSVREAPHSDIIPITYRSKNESLAISAANAVADAIVVEYKHLATRQYDEIIAKLEQQATFLRKQIAHFDSSYQGAVHGDPLAAAASGLDSLGVRLETIDEARSEAQAKLAQDTAALVAAATGEGGSGLGSVIREETLARDPAFTTLSQTQAKDLADYESMKAGYTDAFPGLAGLQEKVDLEASALDRVAQTALVAHRGSSPTYAQLLLARQASQSAIAGDRARIAALDGEYSNIRTRLDDLPRETVPADNFRVQRDGAVASFAQIESRLNTAIADKNQAESLNSIVILDHATGAVQSTSPLIVSAMLVFIVLALAIGAAYLAEMLDPRVRTRADVEGLYGSPLIGSL